MKLALSNGGYTLIDKEDFEKVSNIRWYRDGRYAVNIPWKGKKIYLHRLVMNTPDKKNIDHINGDKLDNRKINLRPCNQSQNTANSKLSKANKTGYKGVFFREDRNKYVAYITFNRKRIHLGHYNNLKEAAKVYEERAVELFGSFASSGAVK